MGISWMEHRPMFNRLFGLQVGSVTVDSTTYLILPSKYSPDLNPKELKCLEIFVSSNTGDYRWPAELSKAINKFTHLTSNTFINQLECLIVNEFTFHFKHLPGFPVTVIYPKKNAEQEITLYMYMYTKSMMGL